MKPTVLVALALLWSSGPAVAQAPRESGAYECSGSRVFRVAGLTGPSADFARAAELLGRAPLRLRAVRRLSSARSVRICGGGAGVPWGARLVRRPPGWAPFVALLPFSLSTHYNSGYPSGLNDGALWAGRGVSTALRGGLELHWGPLSAAVAPVVAWQQNLAFPPFPVDEPGVSVFRHRGSGGIDWPERFGDAAFWTLHPGRSYVRVDAFGVAAGASTENLWWGPALRNPLLMSSTAPGFPHVFLGTSGPVDIWIGRLEAQAVWGRLSESDYFDADPSNDERLFAGVVLAFSPRGLPGLSFGFSRAQVTAYPPDGLRFPESLIEPYKDVAANPSGGPSANNQLISLFARWALPESGFEAYVEWGRDDNWEDWADLIAEPDHAQAWTFGFQKLFDAPARWVRLYGEATFLGTSSTFRSGRPAATFYTHSQLSQGYTHRGQLLGAGIGPGSESQILGADLYTESGRIGGYIARVHYDTDAYYTSYARRHGFRGADVELSARIHQLHFFGDFGLRWAVGYSHRWNRDFLGLGDGDGEIRTDGNWMLELGAVWRPGVRWPAPGAKTAAAAP